MQKSLVRWQLAGFVFTGALGTLFHFFYDWSGKNSFIAAFSATNESTWEHMKLLFFPMFLFALVENLWLGKTYRNFWFAKAAGTLLGLTLIPALFYTWNGVFGPSPDWVNISIFFVAAAAAYALETRLLMSRKGRGEGLQTASLLLLWLLALAFAALTWFPIHIPLFQDPVTGGYGING